MRPMRPCIRCQKPIPRTVRKNGKLEWLSDYKRRRLCPECIVANHQTRKRIIKEKLRNPDVVKRLADRIDANMDRRLAHDDDDLF